MSRSIPDPILSNALSRPIRSNGTDASPEKLSLRSAGSGMTALSIEFVAKPGEANRLQASLPVAIHGALGEVAGFAGSFVMIANHEARLVTVVTLWKGEERSQRCDENVRWVRALLAQYVDRCLRVQTMTAYVPAAPPAPQEFEYSLRESVPAAGLNEEESLCMA